VRLARHEVVIAAPAAVVWEYLTTADGLVRWVGPDAVAEPAPGGALRWTHPDGSTVIGRFVELAPHRRVVFTFGWEDARLGVGPGSTQVEVELDEHDGLTTVRLTHHGLPPAAVDDHERGWVYFLGVLRDAL
jgi:uncharacterized protein YndB with AHSA1/START domain